jgi:hypothetical protein
MRGDQPPYPLKWDLFNVSQEFRPAFRRQLVPEMKQVLLAEFLQLRAYRTDLGLSRNSHFLRLYPILVVILTRKPINTGSRVKLSTRPNPVAARIEAIR